MRIDPAFDFWTELNPRLSFWDSKGSADPDTRSQTLREAHRILWSKHLPTGQKLELAPVRGTQLQWREFRLSSDSIGNSYLANIQMQNIVRKAGKHAEELFRCGSKIGGYILFPAYRVDQKITINGARGLSLKIADRMDLTLEAIRRHYLGVESPLTGVLERYSDFFKLFLNFQGYVDFWLLNDLVDEHYEVQFYLPFDNFVRNGAPVDVDEYLQLKQAAVRFLELRTTRLVS